MAYEKIKSYSISEADFRIMWRLEYCEKEIFTFDSIRVLFFEDMFDHVFFESKNRNANDKSILSLNRLEKFYWIKEALNDPEAILKKGWDKKKKDYFKDRRVAIVKGNYVVIIVFTGYRKANFVTAYEKNDIGNILRAPDFLRSDEYF